MGKRVRAVGFCLVSSKWHWNFFFALFCSISLTELTTPTHPPSIGSTIGKSDTHTTHTPMEEPPPNDADDEKATHELITKLLQEEQDEIAARRKTRRTLKRGRRRGEDAAFSGSDNDNDDGDYVPMKHPTSSTTSPPRRSARGSKKAVRPVAAEPDPLEMVLCESYSGAPGTDSDKAQPFQILVERDVFVVMDFHSHMTQKEIIGFLAGWYDDSAKKLHIQAAFPCRSLGTEDDDVQVEMDPASEVEVRSQVSQRGVRIIGWYHSHPTFEPEPSRRDIENQTNYQTLFRNTSSLNEPFVGAIVGPYDDRLPSTQSAVNWFFVQQCASGTDTEPMRLKVQVESNVISADTIQQIRSLHETYRNYPERVNWSEAWRITVTQPSTSSTAALSTSSAATQNGGPAAAKKRSRTKPRSTYDYRQLDFFPEKETLIQDSTPSSSSALADQASPSVLPPQTAPPTEDTATPTTTTDNHCHHNGVSSTQGGLDFPPDTEGVITRFSKLRRTLHIRVVSDTDRTQIDTELKTLLSTWVNPSIPVPARSSQPENEPKKEDTFDSTKPKARRRRRLV